MTMGYEGKTNEFIIFDMRNELYPILGRRIEKAQSAYSEGDYNKTFKEINSIKTMMSAEMKENIKTIFDIASNKINDLLLDYSLLDPKNQKDAGNRLEKLEQIKKFLLIFMEMTFKEMSAQGVWFPKGKRYDSFDTTMMEDSFGIKPEKKDKKIKKLKEIGIEKLFELMGKNGVEDLYARHIIDTVMQD